MQRQIVIHIVSGSDIRSNLISIACRKLFRKSHKKDHSNSKWWSLTWEVDYALGQTSAISFLKSKWPSLILHFFSIRFLLFCLLTSNEFRPQIAQLVSVILVCLIVIYLASVVQTVDKDIQRVNLYPVDNPIVFTNTYPLARPGVVQTLDSAIHTG